MNTYVDAIRRLTEQLEQATSLSQRKALETAIARELENVSYAIRNAVAS